MPKFRVDFTVSNTHSIEVEAKDADEAAQIFDNKMQLDGADFIDESNCLRRDYDIDSIVEMKMKINESL